MMPGRHTWKYTDEYRQYLSDLDDWKRERKQEGRKLYKQVTPADIKLTSGEAKMNEDLIARQHKHKLEGVQAMRDYMSGSHTVEVPAATVSFGTGGKGSRFGMYGSQPANAQPANAQPANAQPANAQPANAKNVKNGEYFVTYGSDRYGNVVTTRKWRGVDASGKSMVLDVEQARGRHKADDFVGGSLSRTAGYRDLLTDSWEANASRMLGKDMSFVMTDDERRLQKDIKDRTNAFVRDKLKNGWEMEHAKPMFDLQATKAKYFKLADEDADRASKASHKALKAFGRANKAFGNVVDTPERELEKTFGGKTELAAFLKGLSPEAQERLWQAQISVLDKERKPGELAYRERYSKALSDVEKKERAYDTLAAERKRRIRKMEEIESWGA